MFTYSKPSKDVSEEGARPTSPVEQESPFSPFAAADAAPAAAPTPLVQSAPVVAGSRNVLHSDVFVKGILHFSDALLVDGSVEGKITSDGALTVGTNATIIAGDDKVAIHTDSAVIQGKVTGNVEVADFIELAASAELVGDIRAARMIVHDGAVFIGSSAVGVASSMPNLKASPKAKSTATKGRAAASEDLLS